MMSEINGGRPLVEPLAVGDVWPSPPAPGGLAVAYVEQLPEVLGLAEQLDDAHQEASNGAAGGVSLGVELEAAMSADVAAIPASAMQALAGELITAADVGDFTPVLVGSMPDLPLFEGDPPETIDPDALAGYGGELPAEPPIPGNEDPPPIPTPEPV
jgi:hypothetical protein